MKTDVEIKERRREERSTPVFQEVFLRLSECTLFGAIVVQRNGNEEILRWIASREQGRRYTAEASAFNYLISEHNRLKLNLWMDTASNLPMFENQVEVRIKNLVISLNHDLEKYRASFPRKPEVYEQMIKRADEVARELHDEYLRLHPYKLN